MAITAGQVGIAIDDADTVYYSIGDQVFT